MIADIDSKGMHVLAGEQDRRLGAAGQPCLTTAHSVILKISHVHILHSEQRIKIIL